MPISTPESEHSNYKDDKKHFEHVLDCLFVPAVEKAGFNPIRPVAKGSDIIQADIIKNLAEADLVLCDMSILNANVFYELGIRTALDKPIALVADDRLEKIPFDMAILNCKPYKGDLHLWETDEQVNMLAAHITDAFDKADGHNSMWKYFGVAQVGEYKPGSDDINDKFDLLTREVMAMRKERWLPTAEFLNSDELMDNRGNSALRVGDAIGHTLPKHYGGGFVMPITNDIQPEEMFRSMQQGDRDQLISLFHELVRQHPDPNVSQILHCALEAVNASPIERSLIGEFGFAEWLVKHYWKES